MLERIDIIVPTFNNQQYLFPMLESVLATKIYYPIRVIVVNNGHPASVDQVLMKGFADVVQCPQNLGWEGGLKEGLKHSDSKFVMFANDDIFIPRSSAQWTRKMMSLFKYPKVGAVGPSSNCVMGSQNIFVASGGVPDYKVNCLIGFCMLLRREALDKAGGVDDTLPGGDDLDLSIRLRDAGYDLLVDRESFVYHHGFKTGERVHGDAGVAGGWNSAEMTERTNHAIIRKHGLAKWFDTLYMSPQIPECCPTKDTEGSIIRRIVGDGSVLELGCGHQKTVDRAFGVDLYPAGELIPTIDRISVADCVGNVEKLGDCFLSQPKYDYIIARHILEHVHNPIKVLRHWKEYLAPGGKLIVAVPDDTVCDSISLNPEHKNAFTPEYIRDLLSAAGMKSIQVYDPQNYCSLIAVSEASDKPWTTSVSVCGSDEPYFYGNGQ